MLVYLIRDNLTNKYLSTDNWRYTSNLEASRYYKNKRVAENKIRQLQKTRITILELEVIPAEIEMRVI